MAFKKSAASAGPRVWTVAELGAFYTEHRSELLAHANRVLKDSAKAEEITQDALIKFMLAALSLNQMITHFLICTAQLKTSASTYSVSRAAVQTLWLSTMPRLRLKLHGR